MLKSKNIEDDVDEITSSEEIDDLQSEESEDDVYSDCEGANPENNVDSITDEERSSSFSFDREIDTIGNTQSTEELDAILKPKDDNDIDPTHFSLKPCKPRNIYCNNAELIEEIRKYQNGVATDKLGELIIKIAVHMTTMVRFWRYPVAIKEELAQNAIYRMLMSVPKFKLNNPKANAFGYLSMISYRDMLHTLTRHFKQNKARDVLAEAYLVKLSGSANDERVGMLKQTLERSEEYNNFMRNNRGEKVVDTFALSRDEQIKRFKKSKKSKGDDGTKGTAKYKTVIKITRRK